ncbi:MAG: hypothetical protein OXL97_06675 [Chloroflexota bacterium]|nr:hypothetical protein [Chloroflexota bacterium]MDE2884113.1 hypothetical protein [Chloroflexota bacterium]
MKVRLGSLIPLLLGSLLLVSIVACSESTDTQPATAPPDAPSASTAEPLSASDRIAMDAFVEQQQAIDEGWDELHQDFDRWRTGLTSCDRSSAHEALQGFAVDFADVTAQARDLPRAIVTREFADIVIAAAEDEETAFRRLRDRWQPDETALFEQIEQRRADAARAQKEVEDLSLELTEQLEAAAEPQERAALQKFSESLDDISDDWNDFHADYAELQEAAVHLDPFAVIGELDGLIVQFDAIVEAVSGLSSEGATENAAETLQAAAEAEREALLAVHTKMQENLTALLEGQISLPHPTGPTGSPLDEMDAVFEESEDALKQVDRTIRLLIEDDPEEKLADIENFEVHYKGLLAAWDAFHQSYGEWRRTDGGCDRSEVLQSLDRFNLRMGELGREVRSLPRSSHLLPMYNLLVEAVSREEGAIRALRNSWRPFAVDAFKIVDQERITADRLRRQAAVGLEELRSRS